MVAEAQGKRAAGFWRRLGPVLLLSLGLAAPAEARRLALVVGNGAYPALPALPTAAADALAVAGALRLAGYEVTLMTDASEAGLRGALAALEREAGAAEAVVFFYAGHAIQIGAENRLVPVEARLDDAVRLADETLALSEVSARLSGAAGPLILILDAAHPSPVAPRARRLGIGAAGLLPVDAPRGGAAVLSAAPGAVSFDRPGSGQGTFATALVGQLGRPGVSFSDVMLRVAADVEVASVGRQMPWVQSGLRAPFVLVPGGASAADSGEAAVKIGAAEAMPDETPPPVTDRNPATIPSAIAPLDGLSPDLARAVQAELRRIGCYRQSVDGDWGPESRRALARYHRARRTALPDPPEPTEALLRALREEPAGLCPAPARKPAAARPAKPASKPATAAPQPVPEPREGTCIIVGYSIICR